MKKKFIKIALGIFIITWIALTGFFVKGYFESTENFNFCQQKRHELYADKEYWETRIAQTLENEVEWQIVKELHLKNREIRLLTLGKGLKGMLMVNRSGKTEDYDFAVVFDRNGLPYMTDLAPVKVEK